MEAQYELKIIHLTTPTSISILSHIEDYRKPSLLKYVQHKMKRFTQTYSKKKFADRLLERDKLDHLMENLLKNPNYDEELYENLKIRAQEMEDEDLRLQVERNKDFIGTQEDRGSKIFLTLENAKKRLSRNPQASERSNHHPHRPCTTNYSDSPTNYFRCA